MWLLLNSAGPVQRHLRPDRREAATERRTPERVVGALELLGGLGVPPDHDVGVGAQAGHVVRPAHHHVVGGELLEQRLDLLGLGGAVGVAEQVLEAEHRPHRVADGLVQLAGAGGVACVMPPLCRARRRGRRPPSGPRRCRPGCRPRRTPPRRPPARAPGPTSARIRATRSRWPTAYCGSAAAPALHVGVDRRRPPARSRRRGRRARSRPARRRRRCSAASSRCRPMEVRRWTTPAAAPASRTQPHLLALNVAALIDAAVDRRDQEAGAVARARRRPATSATRKASVTTAIEAYSISASVAAAVGASVGEESGRRGGRGGQHHAVGGQQLGSGGRADDQLEAVRGTAQLADAWRPVRTVKPPSLGQRARPARRSRRPGRRRPARREARRHGRGGPHQRRLAVEQRHHLRDGGPRRQRRARARRTPHRAAARPAGRRPPSPSRAATNSATETSSSGAGCGDLGAGPGDALSESTPVRGQLVEVGGHAHHRAGQRAQRAAGPDARGDGGRVDQVEAQRAGQVDRLGTTVEHRLGADVHGHPGDLGTAQLAADRGRRPPAPVRRPRPRRARGRRRARRCRPPTTTVRRWVTQPACQTPRTGNHRRPGLRPTSMTSPSSPPTVLAPLILLGALTAGCASSGGSDSGGSSDCGGRGGRRAPARRRRRPGGTRRRPAYRGDDPGGDLHRLRRAAREGRDRRPPRRADGRRPVPPERSRRRRPRPPTTASWRTPGWCCGCRAPTSGRR